MLDPRVWRAHELKTARCLQVPVFNACWGPVDQSAVGAELRALPQVSRAHQIKRATPHKSALNGLWKSCSTAGSLIDLCVLSTTKILYLDVMLWPVFNSSLRSLSARHADAATIYCTGPPPLHLVRSGLYHTIISGDGRPRLHAYSIDLRGPHSGGRNSNAVALSCACMGGRPSLSNVSH